MKWWLIQFPEEENPTTPLAISPDKKKTLVDWQEAFESKNGFPFQYKLSPKESLDDYIADDLGIPLFSERIRLIIDSLATGKENMEWYEATIIQAENKYRYFAPRFTQCFDILNEEKSFWGADKSILIKAVLSSEKVKGYSIVPLPNHTLFFPTLIAVSDEVKKAINKIPAIGVKFKQIKTS